MDKVQEGSKFKGINLQLFAEGGDNGGDGGNGDNGGDKSGNTGDISQILGEDLYNQVKEKLGQDNEIVISNSGQWIPKAKFDNINNEAKGYKDQIQTLNTTIKELQGKAGDNTELTGQLQKMQDDITAKEKEMQDLKLGNAIQLKALQANPRDVGDIMALINKSDYEIKEDGKIVNTKENKSLEDIIGEWKENKSYLFKENEPNGTGGSKGGGQKKTDPNADPFIQGFLKG